MKKKWDFRLRKSIKRKRKPHMALALKLWVEQLEGLQSNAQLSETKGESKWQDEN